MCELLSEDYANRAANNGANYNDSFEQYMSRCIKRDEKTLNQQIKVQGLKSKLNSFISYIPSV